MVRMVTFRCLKRGLCCIKYWVPVTHLDLLRLEMYGDIDPEEVVCLRDARLSRAHSRIPKLLFRGRERYLALRTRLGGGCVFLLDSGKCSVHPFKPLVCRFYPFVYSVRPDGSIEISVSESAAKECPGLVLDGGPIDERIRASLARLARVRLRELELYRRAAAEWSGELDHSRARLSELVEFLMERARRDFLALRAEGLWVK